MTDYSIDDNIMLNRLSNRFNESIEDDEDYNFTSGTKAIYNETGETVNIVEVDDKSYTATIELPDETIVYDVPFISLNNVF